MLLSKGPKFAPSGKFNQKVLSRISMGFVSLAATLRTRAASRSQNGITWDTLPPIPFPPAHFFLHPKSDKTDQQVAAAFNIFMKKINEQKCLHIADNMSKKMWSALKELGQNKDLNITVSDKGDLPILPIPFVSDWTTNTVRNTLAQVGIKAMIIELKSPNLRDRLMKSRRFDNKCQRRQCRVCPFIGNGGCGKKGVIYRIDCDCGDFYIGETGRPLAERFNEHSRAAEKPGTPSYKTTIWSKHSFEKHQGSPLSLKLSILETERNTTRRRILE
ncbi:hypothetical protein CRE_11646, partial [Caenorhabditis remanei]